MRDSCFRHFGTGVPGNRGRGAGGGGDVRRRQLPAFSGWPEKARFGIWSFSARRFE